MIEEVSFPVGNVAAFVSFLICLAVLAAKASFIYRVLKANTDVNVFNHSIALVFAVSGKSLAITQLTETKPLF